jgi:hypothetical protein
MRYHGIICETAGFDFFIEQVFSLYNTLSQSTSRQYVISASRRMLQVLRHYRPEDDDEEINIETAIELFEELIRKAGGNP